MTNPVPITLIQKLYCKTILFQTNIKNTYLNILADEDWLTYLILLQKEAKISAIFFFQMDICDNM